MLPSLNLTVLNISSNSLSSNVFQILIDIIIRSRTKGLLTLVKLDISNNKLGEKMAQKLLSAILDVPNQHLQIEELNLSRNLIGFKTGAHLMNLLVIPSVKADTLLL